MITLPVFFHSSETATFKDVGMDYKLTDCEVRDMTFVNINCFAPYMDDGDDEPNYTSIFCNGSEFICNLKYEKVKLFIQP